MIKLQKYNLSKVLFIFSIILILGLAIAVIISILPYKTEKKTSLQKLSFNGNYQLTETASPIPLTEDTFIDSDIETNLILTGHFNRHLDKGTQVFFLIEYLEVRIYCNGTEVFLHGASEFLPSTFNSEGLSWGYFILPTDSSTEDQWTIILKNKYDNNYTSAFHDFLKSLATGDRGDLQNAVIQKNIFFVLSGLLFFVFGIVFFFVSLELLRRKIKLHPSVYIGIWYVIIMSLCLLLDPAIATLFINNAILIMFLELFFLLLAIPSLLLYVLSLASDKTKKMIQILLSLSILPIIFYLIAQLLGLTDAFAVRDILILFYGIIIVTSVFPTIYEIKQTTVKEKKLMLFSVLAMMFFYSMSILNYQFINTPRSLFLSIGFVLFMSIQAYLAIQSIGNAILSEKQVIKLEKELLESHIAIMLSQIQPHFLYNALNIIRHLCYTKPELAGDTVEKFAKYLRGNMDSLKQREPIPFEAELMHLKNYLAIEQLRFDDVQIEYDLKIMDFFIPPLSIQPLVENAIKYGVTQCEDGGIIKIKTFEDEKNIMVQISDNGVGFNPLEIKKDDRSHIGIENTRERLNGMCHGTLDIKSTIGVGTTLTIMLPKVRDLI